MTDVAEILPGLKLRKGMSPAQAEPLAREIFALKKQLNKTLGSELVEEKSYKPY